MVGGGGGLYKGVMAGGGLLWCEGVMVGGGGGLYKGVMAGGGLLWCEGVMVGGGLCTKWEGLVGDSAGGCDSVTMYT